MLQRPLAQKMKGLGDRVSQGPQVPTTSIYFIDQFVDCYPLAQVYVLREVWAKRVGNLSSVVEQEPAYGLVERLTRVVRDVAGTTEKAPDPQLLSTQAGLFGDLPECAALVRFLLLDLAFRDIPQSVLSNQ